MQISFRQGIVQEATAGGAPAFLSLGSTGVSLIASPSNPTIVDFTQGQSDYLFQEAANITNAWAGPFTVNTNVWLYWDINQLTGIRTFGTTPYLPVVSSVAPTTSTTNGLTHIPLAVGQMWFNSAAFTMNVWTGSIWNVVVRVFAGSIRGGTLIQNPVGTQVGISNVQVNAGYILYDDDNNPIKKYQPFNLGEFITTTSPLASQFSKIENYRLETAIQTATCATTIAQFKAVCFVGADEIGPANSNNLTQPAIGIATIPIYAGQVAPYVVGGFIVDPLGQFNSGHTFTPGQYVFVDSTGSLTPNPPTNGSLQRMGIVVDPNTIYINIQPQIIYFSGV
jgi:hypothetical protein